MRGRRERVLEIAGGAEIAKDVLTVEQIDRYAEVPRTAQNIKHLLVRRVEERMAGMVAPHRNLLGKRGCEARRKGVSQPAFFLHAQR